MASFKPLVTDTGRHAYDNYHFSGGSEADGFLFCSGVVGSNPDGSVPEDVKEEFRNAWRAIGALLNETGMGYENILEYTSYHIGMHGHIGKFMSVRDEFLSEPWPAWTAIGISELAAPGAHVEIRVVAKRG